MENTEIKPDICVLKIDETEYWHDDTLLEKTGRIFGVYVFDKTLHVHCCELTPSYELHRVESQTEKSLEDKDYDDFVYHDRGGDVIYIHCYTIDGFKNIEKDKLPKEKAGIVCCGHSEIAETSDEAIEEMIEYIQSNGI